MANPKRFDGLPPNFDDLPQELKSILEERQYKEQVRQSHGCLPGDPRLTSMGPDGRPVDGRFGKRLDDESS
jgi:hypothetical protein